MKRNDTLAQFRKWERTERALAAYHETVNTARERTMRALAEHGSAIDYRRERGLERTRT